MEPKQELPGGRLVLTNRKELSLSGVKEVLSFDAKETILQTVNGTLVVRGDEINVTKLLVEQGELCLSGRIDCLIYTNRERKDSGSFWGRLFG